MRRIATSSMVIFLGLAASALSPAAADDRLCPMLYRPVCAVTQGGHFRTFDNACLALKANAIVRHEGACRRRRH